MEEIIVDRRMLIPYALHGLLISLFGIFLYNVEVSIRNCIVLKTAKFSDFAKIQKLILYNPSQKNGWKS